jgi:protein phosphatase
MKNSYSLSFATECDVGSKRKNNEDYTLNIESMGLSIVCDGMGGHAAGEVASKMCAESLAKFFKDHQSELNALGELSNKENRKKVKVLISKAIELANQEVYQFATKNEKTQGMGTTLAMNLVLGDYTFVAHVGDSRVYLFREGKLHQVTEDHSFVNEMVKKGIISKEKAEVHPERNRITRAIGVAPSVVPDVLGMELEDGDCYLLCSDGLSEYFSRSSFERILGQTDLSVQAKEFIAYANKKGGKDNISVSLVRCLSNNVEEGKISAQKKMDILHEVPLFKDMNYKELNQILNLATVVNTTEKKKLVTEGESSHEFYVILKGKCQVTLENKVLAELKQGDYFGEMSLIDRAPRSASVWSVGEGSFLDFSRDDLLSLIRAEPRIGIKLFWSFLHQMNYRLRKTDRRAVGLQKKYEELAANDDNRIDEDATAEIDLGKILFDG